VQKGATLSPEHPKIGPEQRDIFIKTLSLCPIDCAATVCGFFVARNFVVAKGQRIGLAFNHKGTKN